MIKGKWVIMAVLAVAVLMSLASLPLLKLRRKDEVHKTTSLLRGLDLMCRQYQVEFRTPPASLDVLQRYGSLRILDAWQRPVQFRLREGSPPWELRSLGPNPDDPADDLFSPR